MQLSAFGKKFAANSGIGELMEDLGTALRERPDVLFMGGGNPARIPGTEAVFKQCMQNILADPSASHHLFGVYQLPQGDRSFRQSMAASLRKQFGWPLGEEHIAVSNGSQAAFFILHNLFAGEMPDGSQRRIHLPLAPEYVGYADLGLSSDFFSATQPDIELLDDHLFKYHVDFTQLQPGPEVGALCVSRPTNPTGNVISDQELSGLDGLAAQRQIPLIVDGAYGLPFPGIVFGEATPHWNENTILVMSLSKLGLPGVRTGIVVARPDIIEAFSKANAIVNLSCGNLGPAIGEAMLHSGELLSLSQQRIMPFYKDRARIAVDTFRKLLGDLPYRIHKPEGAFFLWLWFEGLPISSQQLYQRIKERGVLVVPGHNFFSGIEADWRHMHECIRVSYAQDEAVIRQGIAIIAEEVARAYGE